MKQAAISARTSAPSRRRAQTRSAPEVVHSSDVTDHYLRGLASAEPLTREAEAELGRKIMAAELSAQNVLLESPAGMLALGDVARDVASAKENVRSLLLNADAPDALDLSARLEAVLGAVAQNGQASTDTAELAEKLAEIRLDPDFVERIDHALEERIPELPPETRAEATRARSRYRQEKARASREKSALVRANMRLVVATARRYRSRGVPLVDLCQEGNLGLIRAADKFDVRRGYRFGTYASWWIRQSIERALLYQSKDVRMPVHLTASRRRVLGAERALSQENARPPSQEEIAERSGVEIDKVRAVRALGLTPISLEAPIGEEGEMRFGDTLVSETDAPDLSLERRRMQERTVALLDSLTPREREILEMRYGLADDEGHTLEEIGRSLSLSRERIRQIESKALAKLRAWSEENGLDAYLER